MTYSGERATDRHDAGAAAESLHLIETHTPQRQGELTGNGVDFLNLKAHPGNTSSNKVAAPTLPRHPGTVKAQCSFIRVSLRGLFPFKPPRVLKKYRMLKLEVQAGRLGRSLLSSRT